MDMRRCDFILGEWAKNVSFLLIFILLFRSGSLLTEIKSNIKN